MTVQKIIKSFGKDKMMRKILTILVLVISTNLLAEEWHIKKTDKNLVKFTSTTTLLDFDGVTSNIDGYIYWEGEEIFGNNNEIYFEVDLNSVKTGIGKRDRDMREDVLETDKWPKTSFNGNIKDVVVKDNNQFEIVAVGLMSLHGFKKDLEVRADINITEDVMNVVCNFSVFLDEYGIEAPSLLAFVKVADEIKLHLDFQLEKIMEN